jgi:hypothetical protein
VEVKAVLSEIIGHMYTEGCANVNYAKEAEGLMNIIKNDLINNETIDETSR